MPIFEYDCETCGSEFEELVFGSNGTSSVNCPECSSLQVKRKISTFASKVAGGSSISVDSAASCSPGGV